MAIRTHLNDFVSIHCFKSVIIGMEDILGEDGTASALIAAGRRRGANVAAEFSLTGKNPDISTVAGILDSAVGKEGTCLCQVTEVSETPEGGYLVKTKETVCSAGEPAGSTRACTYTLGAVMGFLEAAYGKRLTGKHVASVLSGSESDDFLYTPVA